MTDKKLTDEEIIRTLECCAYSDGCERCQCSKQCDGAEHLINALDLINRQKAENERLKTENKIYIEANQIIGHQRDQRDKEIDELQKQINGLDVRENKIKTEAYTEFAKEVEEEIKKAYNNNSGVLREHLEKHKEKPDFEFVAAIQGKMNTLRGLDDFIDSLLKEMVGE